MVGAVAAVVFVARARDVRLVPSLVVGADGAWRPTLAVCLAASAVFKYERLVARVLPLVGLGHHLPSTLGAMLSLFALLRLLKKAWSPAEAERLQRFLSPGVDFLGKWTPRSWPCRPMVLEFGSRHSSCSPSDGV